MVGGGRVLLIAAAALGAAAAALTWSVELTGVDATAPAVSVEETSDSAVALRPSRALHPQQGAAAPDTPTELEHALRGRVLSRAGRPVAGADVEFRPEDASIEPSVTKTDARGAFSMETLTRGNGVLEVRHGAYFGYARKVTLGMSSLICLDELAAVRGRVVTATDDSPAPIRSVRVVVSSRGPEGPWRSLPAHSWHSVEGLPEGQFKVHVRTSRYVRVVVAARDLAPISSPAVRVRSGNPREFILRARAGVRITGSVVDTAGDPVAGAAVTLATKRDPHVMIADAKTGRDGRFSTSPVSDGNYVVMARSPQFLSTSALSTGVVRGRAAPSVQLQLMPAGQVRGTVSGPRAQATPRLRVLAMRVDDAASRWQRHRSTPVRAGAFGFVSLPPGEYRFELRGVEGSALAASRERVAGGELVRIALELTR